MRPSIYPTANSPLSDTKTQCGNGKGEASSAQIHSSQRCNADFISPRPPLFFTRPAAQRNYRVSANLPTGRRHEMYPRFCWQRPMRLRLQVQRRGAFLLPASVREPPCFLWPQYYGVWRKPGYLVSPAMCSWAARCCNEWLWTYRDHRCDMRPGDENMERHLPVRDTSYKTRRHRVCCTPLSQINMPLSFLLYLVTQIFRPTAAPNVSCAIAIGGAQAKMKLSAARLQFKRMYRFCNIHVAQRGAQLLYSHTHRIRPLAGRPVPH